MNLQPDHVTGLLVLVIGAAVIAWSRWQDWRAR